MASFNEAIFILTMVLIVLLFIYKLYNALNGFMVYDMKTGFLVWIIGLFIYGVNFIITITSYDNITLNQLFKLLLLPMAIITLMTLAEIFKGMQTAAESTQRGRYDPGRIDDYRARF